MCPCTNTWNWSWKLLFSTVVLHRVFWDRYLTELGTQQLARPTGQKALEITLPLPPRARVTQACWLCKLRCLHCLYQSPDSSRTLHMFFHRNKDRKQFSQRRGWVERKCLLGRPRKPIFTFTLILKHPEVALHFPQEKDKKFKIWARCGHTCL